MCLLASHHSTVLALLGKACRDSPHNTHGAHPTLTDAFCYAHIHKQLLHSHCLAKCVATRNTTTRTHSQTLLAMIISPNSDCTRTAWQSVSRLATQQHTRCGCGWHSTLTAVSCYDHIRINGAYCVLHAARYSCVEIPLPAHVASRQDQNWRTQCSCPATSAVRNWCSP